MFVKIGQLGSILWVLRLPFKNAASQIPVIEEWSAGGSSYEEIVRYRLPNDTKPETYDLSLLVNATRELTLHSKGLRIKSIRLTNRTDPIALLPWRTNNATDFLIIPTKSGELLTGNRYRLDIEFAGELQNVPSGFYRAPSDRQKPNERWIAATHFEPIAARSAFPCYDEPSLKANVTIAITHGGNYSAVSNMPGKSSSNDDGTVTTRFVTTPLLSTYSIAFAVTDFRFKENAANSKLGMRVFATAGNYAKISYPLVCSV